MATPRFVTPVDPSPLQKAPGVTVPGTVPAAWVVLGADACVVLGADACVLLTATGCAKLFGGTGTVVTVAVVGVAVGAGVSTAGVGVGVSTAGVGVGVSTVGVGVGEAANGSGEEILGVGSDLQPVSANTAISVVARTRAGREKAFKGTVLTGVVVAQRGYCFMPRRLFRCDTH